MRAFAIFFRRFSGRLLSHPLLRSPLNVTLTPYWPGMGTVADVDDVWFSPLTDTWMLTGAFLRNVVRGTHLHSMHPLELTGACVCASLDFDDDRCPQSLILASLFLAPFRCLRRFFILMPRLLLNVALWNFAELLNGFGPLGPEDESGWQQVNTCCCSFFLPPLHGKLSPSVAT